MIRYVSFRTHNTTNKNFGRLALLYRIHIIESKNNFSFISTESHLQILLDQEDLITSLPIDSNISSILFQVIKSLNSCRKPVWLTTVLSVVFLATLSTVYYCDRPKLIHTEIYLCFFAKNTLFFSATCTECFETTTYNVMITFKNVNKLN